MATKKPAAEAAVNETVDQGNWIEDRVTIRLPRAPKGEENFVIAGVNGHIMKVMRGVDVEVPRAIAQVLEDSRRAVEYADNISEKLSY